MKNHSETIKQIEQLLVAWGATEVVVTDNSHLHVGHEGAKSGGGHFAVLVKAQAFKGLNRIKAHRLVYQQLNELFTSGAIHALEVEAQTEEKHA
ncbi:BolA family transcriptional regulator [Marinicella sp. S1101]|uniref:BolA family protein n=1 Tax=Marinicella marina TaxID=2996016 RepID=UPI0022610374|nr:BolA family protein [Marinicella marina]MCX7554540.1 BolA family transcriptional regulator [Marinicella marina]MDJ1141076.1 BolA family protein [Marinicella marina]